MKKSVANHIYHPLFESLTLPSGVTLKNRIMVAPMTTWSSNEDGTITEDELAYIRRRTTEVGAWITSCAYVIDHGKAFTGQWSITDERYLNSLMSVANAIHEGGAKAIIQIHHGGKFCPPELIGGDIPLSASAVPYPKVGYVTPREMTQKEILETIQAYGNATRLAILAGFDGVEIHGANTYLIQQFFSPQSNVRTDEWGGSLENRLRLPLAIVKSVQENVALFAKTPFIVGYRLSPEEPHNPGISIEDTLVLVDHLSNTGMDYIHVSTWDYWKGSIRNEEDKVPMTDRIKARVGDKIPVVGVGTVKMPSQALDILNRGTDLVAIGTAILKDPDWLLKVREGREQEINHVYSHEGRKELVIPEEMWNRVITW